MAANISRYISQSIYRQAGERANHASHELEAMDTSASFVDFQRHWRNFLEAADDVFEKLKTACAIHPTSRQCWKAEEKARSSDPLLQWMMQARNADKHGSGLSVEFVPGTVRMTVHPGDITTFSSSMTFPMPGTMETRSNQDFSGIDPSRIHIDPAWPRMLQVEDQRFNTSFPVPTLHLGKPFTHPDARLAADLTCTYLAELLSRCRPSPGQ